MSHDHRLFLEEVWKKDEEVVKMIVVNNSLQEIYQSIFGKEKITPISGEVLEIICMDGRLDETNKEGSVYVRDGGSGILRNTESVEKVADGYVRAAMELGVGTIRLTSHGDCGAWVLSGKNQEEGEQFYNNLRDIIYQKVKEADLPVEVVLENIPKDDCNKEGKGLCFPHIERAAYYASVSSFNPQAVVGLPAGFVISREYFEPDYAMANVAIAIKIAFGSHGFGEKFSDEQPFLLVAVADSKEKMEESKKELERAKKEAIEKYLQNISDATKKILIVGVVVEN